MQRHTIRVFSLLLFGLASNIYSKIDFFDSMGWHLEKNISVKQLHFFADNHIARDSFNRLTILERLYNRNEFSQKPVQGEQKIPKTIHQIWVGPHRPPAIFEESQKSIKKHHPDWEYKLWTDADIPSLQLYNQHFYDLSDNYGEKADILRYELLYRYGGVYIDVDFICMKPLDILSQYDLWAGTEPLDCMGNVSNAIIGSIPSHPILEDCILTVKDYWSAYDRTEVNNIVFRVGPGHFQRSLMKFIEDPSLHLIVFPSSFFYSINIRDRVEGFKRFKYTGIEGIKSLTKPESFAVHCFAGSWWGNKDNDLLIK
ncbi:hypothetical protein H0X06_07015 [Candidatus Dependentiae bacterium]|nr:hypothetical protein [Candidatus Dependentiae bacterium]